LSISSSDFKYDLRKLHLASSRKKTRPILSDDLFGHICDRLVDFFKVNFETKTISDTSYTIYLRSSLEAVNAFRDALPTWVFEPRQISRFSEKKVLDLREAHQSFGRALKANLNELSASGHLDLRNLYPAYYQDFDEPMPRFDELEPWFDEREPRFYETEPFDPDDRIEWRRSKQRFQTNDLADWKERKREFEATEIPAWKRRKLDFEDTEVARWKQRKAEYEKIQKQYNEHSADEQVFIGTPFYDIWLRLKPEITFTRSFSIDPKRWFEGTWIVAPQGRGKSNLLRNLILDKLSDACVIIMDAKGDLINSFQRHAAVKDRLVFLNPDKEYPLAINPLDIGGHSSEFLEYIFEVLNTGLTTNHSTLLSMVLTLCSQIEGANLETLRSILQHGWKPYEEAVRKLKPIDQDFFYHEWDSTLYKARRPEVLGRLRALLKTPAFDEILQSKTTKVDMGKLMDEGKIVLIDNNYEKLGDSGAEFFGRMFIALVWAAGRRRSLLKDKGKPVYFFIDEAHWTIKNDTKVYTIVQQCRSQKIAMVFAHQEMQQIKNQEVRGALNNCAIKFAKPNAVDETNLLAKTLRTTPEFLDAQTKETYALYVLEQTPTAITVNVPLVADEDGNLTGHSRLTDEEFAEVQGRSRKDYCNPKIATPEFGAEQPTASNKSDPSPNVEPDDVPPSNEEAAPWPPKDS
jgi:hypothetical protein